MGIFYKENSKNTWFHKFILEFNYLGCMYILEWHMHLMIDGEFFVRLNKDNTYHDFKSCYEFNNKFRDTLES